MLVVFRIGRVKIQRSHLAEVLLVCTCAAVVSVVSSEPSIIFARDLSVQNQITLTCRESGSDINNAIFRRDGNLLNFVGTDHYSFMITQQKEGFYTCHEQGQQTLMSPELQLAAIPEMYSGVNPKTLYLRLGEEGAVPCDYQPGKAENLYSVMWLRLPFTTVNPSTHPYQGIDPDTFSLSLLTEGMSDVIQFQCTVEVIGCGGCFQPAPVSASGAVIAVEFIDAPLVNISATSYEVTPGQSVQLTCTATGDHIAAIVWTVDGTDCFSDPGCLLKLGNFDGAIKTSTITVNTEHRAGETITVWCEVMQWLSSDNQDIIDPENPQMLLTSIEFSQASSPVNLTVLPLQSSSSVTSSVAPSPTSSPDKTNPGDSTPSSSSSLLKDEIYFVIGIVAVLVVAIVMGGMVFICYRRYDLKYGHVDAEDPEPGPTSDSDHDPKYSSYSSSLEPTTSVSSDDAPPPAPIWPRPVSQSSDVSRCSHCSYCSYCSARHHQHHQRTPRPRSRQPSRSRSREPSPHDGRTSRPQSRQPSRSRSRQPSRSRSHEPSPHDGRTSRPRSRQPSRSRSRQPSSSRSREPSPHGKRTSRSRLHQPSRSRSRQPSRSRSPQSLPHHRPQLSPRHGARSPQPSPRHGTRSPQPSPRHGSQSPQFWQHDRPHSPYYQQAQVSAEPLLFTDGPPATLDPMYPPHNQAPVPRIVHDYMLPWVIGFLKDHADCQNLNCSCKILKFKLKNEGESSSEPHPGITDRPRDLKLPLFAARQPLFRPARTPTFRRVALKRQRSKSCDLTPIIEQREFPSPVAHYVDSTSGNSKGSPGLYWGASTGYTGKPPFLLDVSISADNLQVLGDNDCPITPLPQRRESRSVAPIAMSSHREVRAKWVAPPTMNSVPLSSESVTSNESNTSLRPANDDADSPDTEPAEEPVCPQLVPPVIVAKKVLHRATTSQDESGYESPGYFSEGSQPGSVKLLRKPLQRVHEMSSFDHGSVALHGVEAQDSIC